jgi:hypothetical protein
MTDDISKQIEEFLARGGNVYEAKNGESAVAWKKKTGLNNLDFNKPSSGYQKPSSGFHNVLERKLKDGTLRYTVQIHGINYGTLPSLDLAVLRRNKVWAKLGITEDDFV